MDYIVTYSKIRHGYVRISKDGVLKLSIPIKLKGNANFEAKLLEKGKKLFKKIENKKYKIIDSFGDNSIFVFGKKYEIYQFYNIFFELKHEELEDYYTTNFFIEKYLKILIKNESTFFLEKYSRLLGIPYNNLSIKKLKSKWGSCSSSQNIVINMNLIFLPKIFLEYVCIHEICHLKEKNHSINFWNLVNFYFPDYKNIRKLLKNYIL